MVDERVFTGEGVGSREDRRERRCVSGDRLGASFRSADEVGADARRFGTLVGRFGRERTWSFQAGVNFELAAFAGSAIARRGVSRRADLPVRLGFASARTREPGRRAAVEVKAIVFFVCGSNGKCGGRALRRDGKGGRSAISAIEEAMTGDAGGERGSAGGRAHLWARECVTNGERFSDIKWRGPKRDAL